ncbi:hypothetical protein GSI_05773 [Ganoderma sinense ZZ0214-1]|uniref:Uncharacterized protein n=1 Tax=Ganoderma sinense ZZ0214-1 TaxID=1077348 RepID=A0A2G8SBD4_9APHY|nr:hypothetical protein GSI_05773 [Ganoderma sinense ZZ0214-1]
MEIDSLAGLSTFRPTPALGVTYLLDAEDEDVKIILPVPIPIPPVDDPNDEDYDPSADQDIEEDELEDDDPEELDGPPYPTPSSIVRGKRKATEIYVVDDDESERRQSDRLRRKKRARLGRSRKEPEYISISSDSEDDEDEIMEIPKPAPPAREKKVKFERGEDPPAKPRVASAASKEESEQDPDESSASPDQTPEAETGSVERVRPKAPNWLELQLTRTRKRHPSAKLEINYHYSIEGDVWKVECNTCPRTCAVGPGQSLGYLNKHLGGWAHQVAIGNCKIPAPRAAPSKSNDAQKGKAKAVPEAASRQDLPQVQRHRPAAGSGRYHSPAQPATPPRHGRGPGREKETGPGPGQNGEDGDGDDVERFLDQLGLSVALAPKLRSFGFADDKRMSLMGRLSDESLGLLMEHLRKEGVDLVAAIMVREGLKRRAGTL